MSRKVKLITPKGEDITFTNHLGRPVEVDSNSVEDVLLLSIGYERESNGYIEPEKVERIKKLIHQQRLDLLLARDDLATKEVEVNDDIEKLPKEIKYGNGLWRPEIELKLNNKRNKFNGGSVECYYDKFPGGIYLWEIRYKEVWKDRYMNTNNAGAFSGEHLVGVGMTLSDAVFEIEKGLRTKYFTDISLDEERRKYFNGEVEDEVSSL